MSRMSLRCGVALVSWLAFLNGLVPASGQGQTPPQVRTENQNPRQELPAFRSRITLVPLDVRVLDRDGKPVTDLAKADFSIFEDSEPQEIVHFATHRLVAETAPPRTRPALRQAPSDALTPQRSRTFLIVLGRGRIQQPFDAVNAMIRFVREQLLPQDQVGIMAFNRATDFTTDREPVIKVLERYRDRHERIEALLEQYYVGMGTRFRKCKACLPEYMLPSINDIFIWPGAPVSRELPEAIGEDDDQTKDRNQRFFEALLDAELGSANALGGAAANDRADLIAGVSGGDKSADKFLSVRVEVTQDSDKLVNGINLMKYLDGEKHLVFLSKAGLSLIATEEDETIFRAAANARVALHSIVTGGVSAVGGTSVDLFPGMVLKNLAENTGGIASLTRYPAEAIASIDAFTRFEYLLGYYPTHDTQDGKYRKIEVKVNRPGVTVLVRGGYFANDVVIPGDPVAFMTHRRVADVGAYRDNVRDLKLTLKVSQAKSPDKRTPGDVLVDLKIDPARIGFDVVDGRHVAKLEVRVYCGDAHETIVGERASTVSLNLTDDSYRRYLRSGVPYTARIPVTAAPRYVKVVAYDAASDLAGSAVERLK